MKVWIDIETRSRLPIKEAGTYRYTQNCEVILLCWAVDDGPVHVGEPEALASALRTPGVEAIAHNSAFEREALSADSGCTELTAAVRALDITSWRCSSAKAGSISLPLDLGGLCMALGAPTDKAKILDGKRLIKLFCIPQKITKKNDKEWFDKTTHPEDWKKFIEYCIADVESMRWCWNAMPGRNYEDNRRELPLWHTDQVINKRGIPIDIGTVKQVIEILNTTVMEVNQKLEDLTGGQITSPSQNKRILEYCGARGVHLKDLTAFTVKTALDNPRIGEFPEVQKLLTIRQYASKSSVAKYKPLLNEIDGVLRYCLQFAGALRTARWAGRMFQPQNLPRPDPTFEDEDNGILTEQFLDLFLNDQEAFKILFGDDSIIPYASSAIRSMIKAPPGYKLVAADLAGIEACVLAWLSDFQQKIIQINSGVDLYKKLASEHIFHVPLDQVTKAQRFSGKVGELACGYQGWANAVCSMAKDAFGVVMEEKEGARIAGAWRKANEPIVELWDKYETAFVKAFIDRDPVRVGDVVFALRGDFMLVKLPSGRCLHYYKPHIRVDGKIQFWGMNSYTRSWELISTYGGKLTENICQATARDVIARGIMRAEKMGYEVFMTVHDEVVALVPEDSHLTHKQLCGCLSIHDEWMFGLPLRAEGFTSTRYRK